MSTRSYIGRLNDDKSVTFIYCHWDGYLSGVGERLVAHWTDLDKLNKLFKLGDLSTLGPNLGKKVDFENTDLSYATVSYKRDRGDTGTEAQTVPSEAEFWATSAWTDYWYLFKNGRWHYRSRYKGDPNRTKKVPLPKKVLTPAE